MNKAAATAKGVAKAAEIKVTKNEPAIIGKAPTKGVPSSATVPGFQMLFVKKSPNDTPSVTKVDIPLLMTKYRMDSTMKTMTVVLIRLMVRPNDSNLRLLDFFIKFPGVISKRNPPLKL